MTDAYQNRIATVVPRLRYGAIGSGFLPGLQLGFLACMNDILNGGAEDFLHWAVPGEHAVLDAVEESAGCRRNCLRGPAPNSAAGREHAVRSSGQVNRDPAGFQPAQHGDRTDGY